MLYFSLHRYDNGLFYPGKDDADHTYIGGQSAPGFNVNVAWNNDKMGDSEYLSAFHHILMPIAYEVRFLYSIGQLKLYNLFNAEHKFVMVNNR